ALALVELGCHHEEQHQELLLTDLLHLFSCNAIEPAVWPGDPKVPVGMPGPIGWIAGAEGVHEIGAAGDGFAFDCEGPRHR
ncbi:ergothioneine biosynthesis protein EgtB, partial [Mycobacterium tuberculosis]|nr:ergothioneine biosynthesis protein EgtB [Mycobacterium tuberculosis]